jgi:hypothetical protein
MKNKTFLSLVTGLLVGTSALFGIDATFTITPNGANIITNLITGPITLLSMSVYQQGNNSTNFWAVYDSKQTNNTLGTAQGYTLTSYSNGFNVVSFNSYTTNITKTVTNFSGVVTNQVYSGLWTYTTTNAPTTNQFRKVWSGNLGSTAGTIVTMPIETAAYFAYGLTWSNSAYSTNLVINVSYVPSL